MLSLLHSVAAPHWGRRSNSWSGPRKSDTAAVERSPAEWMRALHCRSPWEGSDRRGAHEDAGEPLGVSPLRSDRSVGFRRRDSPAEPLRPRGCHGVPLSAGDRQQGRAGIGPPGTRRLHFSKLRPRDRRLVSSQLSPENIRALYVSARGRQTDARSECWRMLCHSSSSSGSSR